MNTSAPGCVVSAMNPVRVPLVVSGTGLAATRLLARSLTPATAILPTVPRPEPRSLRLLACMFLTLPPTGSLICFHRPSEQRVVGVDERLADAVQHKPRCFLRNVQVSVQFHAGDAL